jgi:hypothetical protein
MNMYLQRRMTSKELRVYSDERDMKGVKIARIINIRLPGWHVPLLVKLHQQATIKPPSNIPLLNHEEPNRVFLHTILAPAL